VLDIVGHLSRCSKRGFDQLDFGAGRFIPSDFFATVE
jgi:hypothetical protein